MADKKLIAKETHTRSLAKAISWRILATLSTIVIVYIVSGKIRIAITAGIIESIWKILLFWFHERLWQRINFGKKLEQ